MRPFYQLPPPLLLQSVTLLACSRSDSPRRPDVVLDYCTFQGTAMYDLKCFILFVYVLFVYKVLEIYYSTVLYSRLC